MTELFDAVRDLSESVARSRVDAHPSAAVRREVLGMLEADRRNDSPLRPILNVVGAIERVEAPRKLPAALGAYKVTGRRSEGDGAIVLNGACATTGRPVLIKVLDVGAWSGRALGRFSREVALLGRLSHPGIARILDSGTDHSGASPRPYFVTEGVEGQTLDEWCRAATRTPREVVALFAELVDAVGHAHECGVTSLGLTPREVVVGADGRARILDAGVSSLAARLGGDADGAAPYMSPEQVSGGHGVDARSDLYAIGVMLYEALAGRMPYDLENRLMTDAAIAIRTEIPQKLGRLDRRLRGDLEGIVGRLLEKHPDERYQSARQLHDDLARHLKGQRPLMGRVPPRTRVAGWTARHPARALGLALIGAILLGSLAYAAYLVARG